MQMDSIQTDSMQTDRSQTDSKLSSQLCDLPFGLRMKELEITTLSNIGRYRLVHFRFSGQVVANSCAADRRVCLLRCDCALNNIIFSAICGVASFVYADGVHLKRVCWPLHARQVRPSHTRSGSSHGRLHRRHQRRMCRHQRLPPSPRAGFEVTM